MKNFCFVVCFFLFTFISSAVQFNVKLVRSFEDKSENEDFYFVSGIAISEDRYIFITNHITNTVSKYNWKGEFVKIIGQKGSGPGDFNAPGDIKFHNNELYVHDKRNYRIIILNKELDVEKTIKLDRIALSSFQVSHDNFFLGSTIPFSIGKSNNFIQVMNCNGDLVNSFFKKVTIWDDVNALKRKSYFKLWMFSAVLIGTNQKKNELIITQVTPNNPAEFYLYSTEGKTLNKFKYTLNNDYKFPKELILNPEAKFKTPISYRINSAFIHKEYILVFMIVTKTYNGEEKKFRTILMFDKQGEFLVKKIIPREWGSRFFHLTEDLHLIGFALDDEVYKVVILKLEFSNSE